MAAQELIATPIHVSTGWINVNTGCQNRCAWCYRFADLLAAGVSMPLPMAEQLVDFFEQLGVNSCIFIGGEPTLYRDLASLVARAKAAGIKDVTVVSNGRRFSKSEFTQPFIEAGLDVFSISIHSADPAVHDAIAGVPCWQETMDGIRTVVRLGGRCSLNVVAGPGNVDNIADSLPALLDTGASEIIISCAIPRINGDRIDGEYSLNPYRFAELAAAVLDAPPSVKILHELPLCILPPETFERLARADRLGYGCHIGTGRGLAVDVDGKVIPCNSFPHLGLVDLFEDGKLRYNRDEFLAVWSEQEDVLELRREANVMRSPHCQECKLWRFCSCGCPLTWGHYSPEDYINPGLVQISDSDFERWTRTKLNP